MAVLSLVVLFVATLLHWGWRTLDWPSVLHTTPIYLGAVAVLVMVALVGLARRLPGWSYSWVALALYGLGIMGEVIVPAAFSRGGTIPEGLRTAYTSTMRGVSLLWVVLALVVVAALARRSLWDALFFFALFLGAKLVTFPILGRVDVSAAVAPLVTGALAFAALVEGAIAGWLVVEFLSGSKPRWRPFWALVALLVVNSLLKFWYYLLQPGTTLSRLEQWGTTAGWAAFYDGGFLVAAFVVALTYRVQRPSRA
jgi:hypothetical protein